ncbi:hypothetical protein V500_10101 [Pseudogymnoascus sp. VKM F-4518 (FW-2643)]|nr:hypothetical protein V500_10101 [Pseudogymnoascus sp. VKM F-4518 (FW-2643)]
MASRTSTFLSDYGTTGFTRARLTFCANHVSPTSTEILTGTAAEAAVSEFTEFDVLDADYFWADREAAEGLARGLERVLDEQLGGLVKMRGEGVDLVVKEEQGGWRRENVFGVWETRTGWGVVVRVRVDVGE